MPGPGDATALAVQGGDGPGPMGEPDFWSRVVPLLRRVAAACAAGAVMGFVVGGIGSRLAMLLLARLNPKATRVISDDGFRIGQFDLGNTLGLLVLCTVLGVVGGLVFLAIRGLRFGPTWFRWSSMVVGPGVVIGSALVHVDGVDFTLLQPAALSIAMFVAIPALAAAGMLWIGDRWIDEHNWFDTSRRLWIVFLLPVFPLVPAAVVVAAAVAGVAFGRPWAERNPEAVRWASYAGRLALTVLFTFSLVDLIQDVRALV